MDRSFQPTTDTPPGTAFHAPQVRLVSGTGEPIKIDGMPISPDIVAAKVTLTHSGAGQVEIVLNNQRHDGEGRPLSPPWRYNSLKPIGFGARVRVDMRYGSEGWTPMILARVTDMGFTFPQGGAALVTLKGEDLLSLLRVNPEEDKKYPDMHEIDMVKDVLAVSKSSLKLAGSGSPAFKTKMTNVTRKKDTTYLKFIESFAERMDYEVFVDFDNPEPGKAGRNPTETDKRDVSFHFEPARSGTLDKSFTLQWARDIIEFTPQFAVWDVLTKVTATGSVPRGRGAISVPVELDEAIKDELHAAPGGVTPLSAGAARASAFADENRPEANEPAKQVTNVDKERAKLAATAALRSSARKFLTAELTAIGFTRLKPGVHVDLNGLAAPFDGIYYVTRTVHSLNSQGYITTASLRRPGMLDASLYPGKKSP
jgi:phage protein D